MKKILLLILSSMTVLSLAACGRGEERTKIVVGLLLIEQESEADLIAYDAALERFTNALAEATGYDVELYESGDYAIGVTALAEGKVDILYLSPFTYYNATQQADVEPLVTTSGDFSGRPYNTIFVTKSDRNDINSLSDLRGKSFAFVDPASASGFLYPSYDLVNELNLDRDRYMESGYFFGSTVYSGGHVNSLVGLLNGNFDAAAIAHALVDFIPRVAPDYDISDLKIIHETEVIPNPFYIISAEMEPELKETLLNFYLSWDDADYFEQIYGDADLRYVLVNMDEVNTVLKVVETLGIEAD